MPKTLQMVSIAAGLVLAAAGAEAVSLINRDVQIYTLTVTEDGQTDTLEVNEEDIIDPICEGACVMQLGDGPQMPFKTDDLVEIAKGKLRVVGKSAPRVPNPR